jgi:TRAP transporter 4TM/12TM fusion protein
MTSTASDYGLVRVLGRVFLALALVAVAYHVVSVFWTFHGAMEHYNVHLVLILLLVIVEIALTRWQTETGRRRVAWMVYLAVLAVFCVGSTAYLYINAQELEFSQPFLTRFQFVIGLLLLLPIFGLNWIIWGAALTTVCLLAALYFGFGQIIPGPVRDLRLAPATVMSYLAGMGGPRGVYTYIPLSADTLFLLLVYGGLMGSTKVLDMFAELGKAIGNFFRGGVAFSCIAASSLVGMVTGQTVSCIALTGSMTIPTMIRRGFTKDEAGAIEVMAANGSQIIPPIMGLGAFLMAVILGVPYIDIVRAAVLPALLYIATLVIGVFCLVQGSPNIPFEREKVDWRKFLWILPSFLPSITLIIVLLSMHYSANLAAFWGILVIVALSFARPKDLRPTPDELLLGTRNGALAGAHLALILAGIGIIVQMLVTTGLGTMFGRLMIEVSGNSKEIALILGMAIAVVIGMGLPTPAAYSLCAIVMIPSLIDVGVDPLVAHFFGFYFAVYSSFTPPVAVGCLMAVRISGGSFARTCIECFKLGAVCILLPFFMVAFPNSLRFPDFTAETLVASALLCVSTLMLSVALYGSFIGRLTKIERAFMWLGPALTILYYEVEKPWVAWLPVGLLVGFIIYRLIYRKFGIGLAAASTGER